MLVPLKYKTILVLCKWVNVGYIHTYLPVDNGSSLAHDNTIVTTRPFPCFRNISEIGRGVPIDDNSKCLTHQMYCTGDTLYTLFTTLTILYKHVNCKGVIMETTCSDLLKKTRRGARLCHKLL